jgi:integrase
LPRTINYHLIDLWDSYIRLQSPGENTNLKIKSSKHFLSVFKDKNIQSITSADIKNYQMQRKFEILSLPKNKDKKEAGISFKMANAEIITLSHFFNFCIEREYIEKNPAFKIKKLNELSRIKTLSDDDINKLINGATNKLTRDLISFLIYTGCRKGEALNLKWDDVDLQNNVITIRFTKTRYDKYVPIHSRLKELLIGIEKKDGCLYVFNYNGAKLGDFKRSFHTACRNAGLKDLRIHDLRHVFASKMVMGGTPLFTTGKLLGQKTSKMTERYSHLVPETLQKAVDDVWNKK